MSNRLSLVPQGVNFVSLFRLNKLVTNEALRGVYDAFVQEFYPSELPPAGEGLEKVRRESGFDPEAFSELLVCGNLLQREYWGGISQGEFVEQDLVAELENARNEKFDQKEHKGYCVYADKRDEFWLCFLGDGKLAVGFRQMVQDIIEVQRGEKQTASGGLYDKLSLHDQELIKLALEMPQKAKNWIEEKTQKLTDFSLRLPLDISSLRAVLGVDGDLIRAHVEINYPDREKAQDLIEVVEGLKRVAIGVIKIPEIARLLRRIEMHANDSSAALNFETPREDLVQAIRKGKELITKVFK